ncbi:MAG: sugar ABC transporter substrate-binding protein [Burkholderiaceae bacterium]
MHIRFITKNNTNPAYQGAITGALAVARQYGAKVDCLAPDIPDDVAQQNELIAASLVERPDAIVLLPAHATGVNHSIDSINAAGIPLVLIVSEASAGSWISYVGTDSEEMAYELGMAMLATLSDDAHVVIMDGHPGSITTPERHRGFQRALRRHPGMTLLESVSGDYQQAPARSAARALLDRHARIDGILVANDLMAMGVLQALDEKGRKASVCSINGTPDAIAEVRRGRLYATASFNTHAFGCLTTEAAIRHLKGESVPQRLLLPTTIIDTTNAVQWDIPYERRSLPSWREAQIYAV